MNIKSPLPHTHFLTMSPPQRPPMNIIEKILCHHAVGLNRNCVQVGDVICVKADWTIASELAFQAMDATYRAIGQPKLHRPDRFWLALDHTVDPRVNDKPKQRALIKLATDFATEHELTDFWGPNTTIMHTEFARQRAQPGQIVIGADSHTCSAGGMGAFAAGLGATDVVMPLVTGQTWFKVPEVVYIEFVGKPAFGIGGKDVILHLLGELKRNTVAFERAVYYGGDGVQHLSDDARFVISNMSTEFGAIAGVFVADEITQRVLVGRPSHNDEGMFFRPDPNCQYAAHHVIDLMNVQPQIALYPSPDNCVPVHAKLGMALDGCFIGACTTTQEDLILAAMVLQQAMLEGKRPVARGSRRVTPGSLPIIARLKELGLVRVFEEAGFTVGVPSCSYCVGIAADVAGENEVWLSKPQLQNRMGKGSIGNLASAACVAASSLDMQVTDPTEYISKINRDDFDRYRNWMSRAEAAKTIPAFTISEPSPRIDTSDAAAQQAAIAALESALPAKFSGKVQKLGDNVDTDAVIPAQFMGLNKSSPLWPPECTTEEEFLASKSFAYVKPVFVDKVKDGFNIIVAGKAFGSGSSREEAAICLKAPNHALLGIVVTDEKFHKLAQEGTDVTIDVRNRSVSVGNYQVHFTLTQLEENFLHGGGLNALFKHYKGDLFRAAMRNKAPQPIASSDVGCGAGCGSMESSVDMSW
ncbi:TPA: LOW QUALITY PROTEIN: hypothetical protein N0F65_000103 [Lagenidium giganteum]|uniref:Aconitase/3-isopropylmalate dehydratase large subunit alpha/beta/alpha domain-containing protein n=1 Tax=Lagenidium giganteum TaxID=4803 RepID=A0AAV2YYK3_9STRA|nr:TPA: LOW QUALITY PROTEIN: hypothetical protein N0F65_000103 [Lagenidium giganteum]